LGAGPAAALGIGPILLVNQNSVPQATLDELDRLEPSEIFIVGGTAVISDGVKATLQGLGFGPTVTRLAGANRFETAAAVSGAIFPHAGFLGANDKAADSELLDGNDSSAFLMPSDVVAAHAGGNQIEPLEDGVPEVVRSVSLIAPSSGVVIVTSTANAMAPNAEDTVACSITTATIPEAAFVQFWESPGAIGDAEQLAGTRGFDVPAGPFTVNLACVYTSVGSGGSISDSALTAIFIPGS
jgi:hypothetical protein